MSGEGVIHSQPLCFAPLSFRTRSGGTLAKDKAFVCCPKCEAPMFIRRSQRITETVKHLHAICTNTGCGLTGMFEVGFVHFFSPGLIERPDLTLRACPRDQIPHVMPAPRDDADDAQMSMFGPPT